MRVNDKRLYPGVVLLGLSVLLSACRLLSTSPATPTTAPTPTATDVVQPLPKEAYQVRAWVAFERPKLDQAQIVYAKLLNGDQAVAGAKMYVVVHYASLDRRWPASGFETSAENGIASTSFSIAEAGTEDLVTVDVYLVHDGDRFQATTVFAPRC